MTRGGFEGKLRTGWPFTDSRYVATAAVADASRPATVSVAGAWRSQLTRGSNPLPAGAPVRAPEDSLNTPMESMLAHPQRTFFMAGMLL